jgi:PKD repeat protein
MKLRYLVLLAILLIKQISVISQEAQQKHHRGVAEAFSEIEFKEIIAEEERSGAYELMRLRKPNPVIYKPVFEVEPEKILYTGSQPSGQNNTQMMKEVSPAPDTTFMGLYDTGNSIPPDVNGAPGPDHLMVTLNTQVRIQHRDGTEISTVSLGVFWASLPGSGTFDPKIQYDFEDDRWVFVTCAGSQPGSSRIYMGVSATSDPTGTWYLYSYIADPDNIVWFDYPSMGFNKNWIVVSGNMFGGGFYSTVYVFDKHAMYNGEATPQFDRFTTTQGFTLVPAVTYDAQEENVYLISSADGNQGGTGYISLFKVSGEINNPVFSLTGHIGIPQPWAGYVGNNGDFLPQLGSNEKINAVDHRMENVVFRNNKLWATHHVFLPANNPQRAAIQWWNITPTGEIIQHGRVDDPTGEMSYAFASLALNQFEDMLIGFNIFSANQYASGGYAYRAHFDPPNTTRAPFQYIDGLAPYYKTFGSGRNRWGDYSATMLDPVNSVDFWTIQQYAELPSSGDRWGTWWAYLRIPFEPVADFAVNETLIPLGESINFSDKSIGIPQEWSWVFEGGTPDQSTAQNPAGITFNNEGVFNVSLTVTNQFGTNSVTKNSFITVSSTLLPEVAFVADRNLICTGEQVSLFDQSLYMPREWEWEIIPSTISFVNGTDAFSQNPQVVFHEEGDYTVKLTAANLNGEADFTEFNFIRVGGKDVPFAEYFESESFSENYWTIVNPDNKMTWELTQVGGLNETTVAAQLDFMTYVGSVGQRDRLITPPFDLRGYSQMQLTFKHAHARRRTDVSDSLIVYISDNCGQSWTRLYQNADNGSGNFATHPLVEGFIPEVPTDWCGAGYGADCITLDISPWAGQTEVKIAFESFSFRGNPLYITGIRVGPTVGLQTNVNERSAFTLYPNPGKGKFTVRYSEMMRFSEIRLFNLSGQEIAMFRNVNTGDEINLENLASGVYFIQARAGSSPEWTKLIVE